MTVETIPYTYTQPATPVAAAVVLQFFVDTLNANHNRVVSMGLAGGVASVFEVPSLYPGYVGITFTGLTQAALTQAGVYPSLVDFVRSMEYATQVELPQGFLMAPEVFQNGTVLHSAMATEMSALCEDQRLKWVAIVDCSPLANVAGGYINKLRTEAGSITSPRGHMAYYAPYVLNLSNVLVPPSPAVVGVAIRRIRQEGFVQPPAGVSYPVYGMKAPQFNISEVEQGVLNPLGVNVVRNIRNKGNVIWAARTQSEQLLYRFITTRVIMNVLQGTLKGAYDSLLFLSIDGTGALFARIKGTTATICEDIRRAGGLYGATANEAYRVVCDMTNNTATDIQSGTVTVSVFVKVSPILEVLVVSTLLNSIATDFDELISTNQVPSNR